MVEFFLVGKLEHLEYQFLCRCSDGSFALTNDKSQAFRFVPSDVNSSLMAYMADKHLQFFREDF